MTKRNLLSIIIIGIMAFVLMACGGSDSSSGEATDSSVTGADLEDATELTFWTFVSLHMEFFEDAAERWNEENPDRAIRLVAETYPYDQMHNNLLLALQSGSGAPDISDIEITRFPNYLQGVPQLLPMNEYVEEVYDQFVSSRFEIYAKDGNYYGMPTHVGASVMYYNKEIMEAAGVDIDSIHTWDDYVEAGKQVVANTDALMTTVHTGDYLPMWQFISQRGSDWFDENGNLTIDAPENIETLQFLLDMMDVHEIADLTPGGQPHAEEFYALMNEGGAASISMPIWYMGRFIDYMPDLKGKMVVRPLPAWEEGGFRSAGMGGTGTVVTNQTEHAELAKDFLAFAKLSVEANEQLWTVLGFDPPRWDVWENEAIQADNRFYQYFGNDIFDVLLEVRDEINAVNITQYTPQVATEMNTNVFNNVLRQKTHTPEEALREAQQAVESNMD
ncbi:arabinosaccharide transport system substrate-binding protein [Evansella vedderi]|uniref:Arabinosaccharide transport system substrate-binding protein n=1 Tax=Evansella vedderi TaxID=38282 RepID=A0ABU0A4V1_9BACI|nr:sugar ABC transporter substrate-binding protein [Evansella vedderi]MDQ0257365.1 arabinosaccharide transport system substrate-binding protein [Evansella vedderi]